MDRRPMARGRKHSRITSPSLASPKRVPIGASGSAIVPYLHQIIITQTARGMGPEEKPCPEVAPLPEILGISRRRSFLDNSPPMKYL
jgi:hypothetical protein